MTRRTARIATRLLALGVLVGALGLTERSEAETTGEPKDAAAKLLGVDPDRDRRKLESPERIDYAKALGQDVVCLCGTCPRHTVTNCDCGWAHYNQRVLQLALLDGKTREDVLKAYEAAYGLKVFPLPPDEGFGRMSYVLPYVAAVAGLLFVVFLGLKMRNNHNAPAGGPSSSPSAAESDEDEARKLLARELDDLD